ncbi:growth/differentiation factor 7 [Bombina bombina]|uniref:growth/differentiation factor 7 n=1 Tax=Bombina bombina TaxID=8345 RepID=UPI00235A7215|nr:growth/differentiation factor 7 [Bombina bombina]
MDLRKAAALCLGLWSAWLWAEHSPQAAVLLSSPHRMARTGALRRAPLGTMSRDSQHHITSRKEPSKKGTVVPHEYMLSLYKRLSSIEHQGINLHLTSNKTGANTITSFVDQGQDDVPTQTSEQIFLFDINTLTGMDEIIAAELRILRKGSVNISAVVSKVGTLLHLQLYTCPTSWQEPQLIDSKSTDLGTSISKWEVFNVWKAMENKRYLITGDKLCFMLKVTADNIVTTLQPVQIGFSRQGQPPHEKALLVVSSHSKKRENLFKEIKEQIKSMGNHKLLEPPDSGQQSITKRRRKRTTLPTRANNGRGHGKKSKTRCSKKPLHVNFKELGWDDWIIAPLDYEAYHCEGVCDFPLRSHLEPTNHAIIQTLMNSMDPESTPPSCCVPSKLSPISILYIDSGNNVVYKQYEDMVVESCGCR